MSPLRLQISLPLTLALLLAASAHAATSDNFNDNSRGSQWGLVLDAPAQITLAEQNSRLEILASAPTDPNTDALYLSNGLAGFRLSTSANFEIALDYSFTAAQSVGAVGSAFGLIFGVGRDLDGTDSASIGYGRANAGAFIGTNLGEGHRIADVQTTNNLGLGTPTGTFVISYNAASDALTLGDSLQSFTLNGTVKGIWHADDLLVSFGARGSGFSTVSGNAFEDNFTVRSGVVLVPEPGSLGLLLSAATALALSRRRR